MKKIVCIILCLVMTLLPMTTFVTAAGTSTEPELVYTVDFRGTDGKFAPAPVGAAGDSYTFTPSADGKELTIKGKDGGANETVNFYGGTIAGLAASRETMYTMIYQVRANGTAGTNNSIGIGGWISEGNVEAANFYNTYSSHNSVDGSGATNARAKLSLRHGGLHSDYVMFDTIGAYAQDADGFMTMKMVFDGATKTFTGYFLAEGKTGENAADWLEWKSQPISVKENDCMGFMVYLYRTATDTTIRNVQIYKQAVQPEAETNPAKPNTAYDLAITEVCPAPDEGSYEYVEVMNTSDSAINLKDYTMTRWGFSNGSGKWECLGLSYIFDASTQTSSATYAKLSLAGCDVELASKEVALIWIVSAPDKDKTVADFKLYWQSKGHDLSNVKIARLEAYVVNGELVTDISAATACNGNAGIGFLPDAYVGYAISMIKSVKLEETVDGVPLKSLLAPMSADYKNLLHSAADSIAVIFQQQEAETNQSHHYYQFVDKEEFADATGNPNDFKGTGKSIKVFVPTGAMVCGPDSIDGDFPLQVYWDMTTGFDPSTASDGAIFVDEGFETLPSPGILLDGQFGQAGYIPATDAAQGVTSTYRVPYTGK